VVSLTHSYLKRAIRFAMARDKVGLNVAELIETPKGTGDGRPSKAFSRPQAIALLHASRNTRLDFYIHLGILHGLRTEEERALKWDRVDDFHEPDCGIDIVEAVRFSGRTKTRSSKRGLTLCQLAIESGIRHKAIQAKMRLRAGIMWDDQDLVFTTLTGGPMSAIHVRRQWRGDREDPARDGPRPAEHHRDRLLARAEAPPLGFRKGHERLHGRVAGIAGA
jgi:hypothetical protein